MNTVETVIIQILYLPERFYKLQNISPYSLLKESGYFELHSLITTNNLEQALTEHGQCIPDWLNWSDDKRTDRGWYLNKVESGKYQVGYFPKNNAPVTYYSDVNKACAAFIKNEIESIRRI